jgi:hypothetical protein
MALPYRHLEFTRWRECEEKTDDGKRQKAGHLPWDSGGESIDTREKSANFRLVSYNALLYKALGRLP